MADQNSLVNGKGLLKPLHPLSIDPRLGIDDVIFFVEMLSAISTSNINRE